MENGFIFVFKWKSVSRDVSTATFTEFSFSFSRRPSLRPFIISHLILVVRRNGTRGRRFRDVGHYDWVLPGFYRVLCSLGFTVASQHLPRFHRVPITVTHSVRNCGPTWKILERYSTDVIVRFSWGRVFTFFFCSRERLPPVSISDAEGPILCVTRFYCSFLKNGRNDNTVVGRRSLPLDVIGHGDLFLLFSFFPSFFPSIFLSFRTYLISNISH